MRHLIFCLYLFSSGVNLNAQIALTLDEVIAKSVQNTLGVKLAKSSKEQTAAEQELLLANLKPGVNLSANLPNYINTSSAITQNDGSISFLRVSQNNAMVSLGISQNIAATGGQLFLQSDLQRFDDFSAKSTLYNGIPVRLGFLQPLFGFNSLKWDRKIVATNLLEKEKAYNIAVEDAKLNAAIFYFDVLIATAEKNIAATNKQVNENLLKITNERFALGKVAENERLQLAAELKLSTLQETQAIYAEQNAAALLNAFLGNKSDQNVLELVLPESMEEIVLNESDLIATALKNQPLVKSFERQSLLADRNLAETKNQYGIRADLFAGLGFARGSDKLSEIYSDPFLEQQVSLSIGVPIIDWGKKNSALKLAELQKQDVINQFEQDKIDFETDIKQFIYLFNRLQKEILLLEEIQTIAEQRFEISNQRYILGNISLTDLTLAQREKDQSKRNFIQGLKSYWVTYYTLRKLTGDSNL